ncbi:MAG: phage tail assembly protein T [Pseudonocardiaceae bacterium]
MRARPERQFYFRLAGHLSCTVAELLARISSRELSEWMVYEKLTGPLGGRRLDIAAAIGAAAAVNANRSRRRPYSVEDFIPVWSKPPRQAMSPEEMWAAVQRIQAGMSGGPKGG